VTKKKCLMKKKHAIILSDIEYTDTLNLKKAQIYFNAWEPIKNYTRNCSNKIYDHYTCDKTIDLTKAVAFLGINNVT